jgi:hypothetical protein
LAPHHESRAAKVEAQKVAMVYKHHAAVKENASKVSQDIINKAESDRVGMGHHGTPHWQNVIKSRIFHWKSSDYRAPQHQVGDLSRLLAFQPQYKVLPRGFPRLVTGYVSLHVFFSFANRVIVDFL